MSLRSYSTGFRDLDTYLGGIRPGDTILILHAGGRQSHFLVNAFTAHLRAANYPLRYLSLSGSRDFSLEGARVTTVSPGRVAVPSGKNLYAWLRRQTGALRSNEVLLTDDLSEWRHRLRNGSLLVDAVTCIARVTEKKRGVAFLTATRHGLAQEELGLLKDAVSVCLGLSAMGATLFVVPIGVRARYPSTGGQPFGFRMGGPTRKGSVVYTGISDFDSGKGREVAAEYLDRRLTADLILKGPLGETKFGILVADLAGEFRASNTGLEKLLGFSEGEISSRPLLSFVAAADRRKILRFIAAARKGKSTDTDVTLNGAGASPVPVRIHAGPAGAGLTVFFIMDNRAGRDEGRKLGLVREENRVLYSDAPYALCFSDSRKIISGNDAFYSLRGTPENARTDGPSLGDCFTRGTLHHLRKRMREGPGGPDRTGVRGEVIRGDGTHLAVRIHISKARHGGRDCHLLLLEDVSEYRAAIGTLEEDERRFRLVAEHMSRPVAVVRELRFNYLNPELLGLMGVHDAKPFEGKPITDFLPAEGAADFTQAYAKFLASKQKSWTAETDVMRPDGGRFSAALTFRKGGTQAHPDVVVNIEDVTERNERESRLTGIQTGTDQISGILESATTAMEPQKVVQAALAKALDVLGWTGGAVFILDHETRTFTAGHNRHFPKTLLDKLSELPADEGLGGYISKTLDSHIFTLGKYPSYLPYRTLFEKQKIKSVCLIPLVHGDAPVGFILGISTGGMSVVPHAAGTLTTLGRQLGNALINARKLVAARDSENQMHRVVDSLSGVVYTAGPDGSIRTIEPGVSEILGYNPRDFYRNRSLYLSLIHEGDKKLFLGRVTGSNTLESTFVTSYRMRPRAKASYRWIRDAVSVERDQAGLVTGFAGLLADVTDERERYETVRSEHTMLRSVQDVLPDGIAVFDKDGKCVEWNTPMEKIAALPRAEALGKEYSVIGLLPGQAGSEPLAEALKKTEMTRLGMAEGKSGEGGVFDVFVVPVPGRGDEGGGFLLRYIDMTRPQAELRRLIETEQVFRNVIDAMDDVMIITDLSGRVAEVNSAFLRLTGFTRQEVIGQEFPYGWLVERDMGRFLVWISRIREQQRLHDFDVTWMTKEKAEIQMSLSTTLVRNSLGEPVAMLNIARDISERVGLVRDLEMRNSQIEMINRVITAANATNDFSIIFGTAADEIVRLIPSHAVMIISGEDEPLSFSELVMFAPDRLDVAEIKPLMHAVAGAHGWADTGGVVGDLLHDPRVSSLTHLADRVRSALVVPVETSQGAVGAMLLTHREPHAFTEEEIALCRPLARQLGGIVERTRLFQRVVADARSLRATEMELRERARQLITLHEISILLSHSFDVGEILTSALPLLKTALGAAAVLVYMIDQKGGDLLLAHQEGLTLGDSSSLRRLRHDNSATGDVVRKREPLYIGRGAWEDTRILPVNRKFLKDSSVEAMAIIPIISRDRVMGALNIFYAHPHEFLEQERYVLSLAGNQLGSSMVNAELYGELKEQIGRLTVLFELSQELTSLLETDEICLAVTGHVRRIADYDRCVISLLAGETGELRQRVRLVKRRDEYELEPTGTGHEHEISGSARQTLASRRTFISAGGDVVAIPMISERTIIGVLELETDASMALDEVQVRLLESIGSLTAIALEKGNLYEETVRKSREIEQRNRELDDFTYVVSHDLKEPLISIEGFSRILQMDYGGVIGTEGKEYLASLVGATTRMKGLIDDLLMLSRMSRPTESFDGVPMGALVTEILSDMEFVIRKRNVTLKVDDSLPAIRGNATQMKILLRNLIGNAIKFNDRDNPTVEIGFRYQENNSYLFWVKDDGVGIEPEFFDKIFIIFQRLHRREEFEGSGAGLAIVKKIIEIHHGKIWVESEKGNGSTFFFTLPEYK